jgi:hypothetical protein
LAAASNTNGSATSSGRIMAKLGQFTRVLYIQNGPKGRAHFEVCILMEMVFNFFSLLKFVVLCP